MKPGFTYIVTNKTHGTLYIGVTSNLIKRIYEHKNKSFDNFSAQYNCKILVYYEKHDSIRSAIEREKQIKGWKRIRKIRLINNINPEWNDLYSTVF